MQFRRGDAYGLGLVDRLREEELHLAHALLAEQLHVAAGDEAALALHGIYEALRLKLGIGPFRGDDADAKAVCERADGGERLALAEFACEYRTLYLRGNLLVDGFIARVRDYDVYVRPP